MAKNTALIGIAGVHHVVSELSRRGMVALPTVRNTAAYDIVVLNPEGTKHANVQVKASSKAVGFFPMPKPDKVRAGRHDYYVLVRWIEKEQRYEGFLLTGRDARAEVVANIEMQDQRIGPKRRPSSSWPIVIVAGIRAAPKKTARWAKSWAEWTL